MDRGDRPKSLYELMNESNQSPGGSPRRGAQANQNDLRPMGYGYGLENLGRERSNANLEWRVVESPKKNNHSGNSSALGSGQTLLEPIITPKLSPYLIFQLPRFHSEESAVKLVSDVISTSAETIHLFNSVAERPEVALCPKQLIILRGVPGSGKSSVAKALQAVTRHGVICSADDYFTDGRGVYKFNGHRLGEAHNECKQRSRKFMERGVSPVIIDNTNTKRFEMEDYVKYAIEFNYKVRVFEPETMWKFDARTLVNKTVHSVPYQKIQEMIARFEQINPFLLVEDCKRAMRPLGANYNPPEDVVLFTDLPCQVRPQLDRIQLTPSRQPIHPFAYELDSYNFSGDKPEKRSNLSDFILHGIKAAGQQQQGKKGELDGPTSPRSPRMAAVFPNDFVGAGQVDFGGSNNLMDQNVSFSTGGKWKRRNKSKEQTLSPDLPAQIIPHPPPNPNNSLFKSAQQLQGYFPTCSVQELKSVLEKFSGDVDDATNYLLDNGFTIAEEVLFQVIDDDEQDKYLAARSDEVLNLFELEDDKPLSKPTVKKSSEFDASIVEGARALSLDQKPEKPIVDAELNNQNNASTNANVIEDFANDGEDWVDLELSEEVVAKLVSIYGDKDDKRFENLPAHLRKIRVPPTAQFEFYRKVVNRQGARLFKAAEDAVQD